MKEHGAQVKTSLLNLILKSLFFSTRMDTRMYCMFPPWLSGSDPVEALFLPVATVIQQEMEKNAILRRASKKVLA
uniref:Uncharacterized protein n=1 Tax=Klebsiella pneumoniae TaxID=573 RepID=A0A8B0SV85_KLEPN|nr:hypothetical protein [Klebsiella pneumoniae]